MPPNPRDVIVVQQDLLSGEIFARLRLGGMGRLNEHAVEDLPAWGVGVRDALYRWVRAREGKGSKVKSHLVWGDTARP